ncbi:cation diffusion facilitator family transporter [Acuticoccus sp. M5D2P5]|uniref:cation diffusion facilitator family transporter n=1 Tax=Acuticoccus kalidii TaxID=2910977 RepID=UPI001F17F62B|nr:cation diffusion facilitator family transporter [Acuticoccus kalidii]MCF3935932.1 cation diffusion facilitator family transporter [Acuticoccus kalidii]
MKNPITLALYSIAVGVAVLGLKLVAAYVTGSVALFSDAMESIVNIVTAIATAGAVRISAAPPDDNHPYGHSKVEYFSAVLEGVFIAVAALAILHAAYQGFLAPAPLEAPWLGIGINMIASMLNGVWAFILIRQGRALRSPALIADGTHIYTDVVTSVGVVLAVVLIQFTGWIILDPAIAALVALNILWSGWRVMRGAVGGLMDETSPDDIARIGVIIGENAEGAMEAHDIRIRHAGRRTFIEFHLIVPGAMTVAESHRICDKIEAALRKEIEDSTITIHVEPEHKAKNVGIVLE